MGKRQVTFGKLQRERDKKAKAAAKRERRMARADEGVDEEPQAPAREHDEAATLAALEALHRSFDEGDVSIDDFEKRRDELTSRLRVD